MLAMCPFHFLDVFLYLRTFIGKYWYYMVDIVDLNISEVDKDDMHR